MRIHFIIMVLAGWVFFSIALGLIVAGAVEIAERRRPRR